MNIQAVNISYKPVSYSLLKQNRGNVSFSSGLKTDDAYINAKRKQQKVREQTQRQRVIALASAMGLAVSGAAGMLISNFLPAQNKPNIIINPTGIEEPYQEPFNTPDFILKEGNTTQEPDEIPEPTAEEVLKSNNDVNSAYNKISKSLQTFSEHLGEDGLALIIKRVDEIGNGKVNPLDVIKILYIESTGRMYSDVENKTILKSSAGARGAFQITKDTQDFVNDYYNFEGTDKELNYEDPYDNLDICIYNLRFIADKRGKELASGKELPTGDNLNRAIMWSYHDGPWAQVITNRGEQYLKKSDSLNVIDEFPQVVDFILNSGE